jgi:hypothetical protein
MLKFQCIHEHDFWQDVLLTATGGAMLEFDAAVQRADSAVLALRERSSLLEGELGHDEHTPDRPS